MSTTIPMFNLFKKDPLKNLNDQYNQTLQKAVEAQRNGDIKTYSFLSKEADQLLKEIENIEKSQTTN